MMFLKKILFPFCYLFILPLMLTMQTQQRILYSKVWAHRVNNLDEVVEKQRQFMGMELDLIYSEEKNLFYVGHDLIDSNKNIYFTDWLSKLSKQERMNSYYWLDMKNINPENADKISISLNEVTQKYNIKSRVWVESYYWDALKTVKEHGFQVILWVENLHWQNELDTAQWFQKTKIIVDLLKPDGISCMYVMYPLLTDMFPDENIFFWHTPADFTPENVALTQKICREKMVKAVLVDYPYNIEY